MEINKVTRNERWDYGLWMKSKAKGRSWCTRKDTQSRSQSRPPNPLDFGWSTRTTDTKLDTEGKGKKELQSQCKSGIGHFRSRSWKPGTCPSTQILKAKCHQILYAVGNRLQGSFGVLGHLREGHNLEGISSKGSWGPLNAHAAFSYRPNASPDQKGRKHAPPGKQGKQTGKCQAFGTHQEL